MATSVLYASIQAPQASRRSGLPSTSQNRLPSLDGWRALSIILVLGAHSIYATGFPRALKPAIGNIFDGNLGVRIFFTISGFLITWLLLKEWNLTQNVSLRDFYIRRCLRILPVYCAFLLTIFILQNTSESYQNGQSWLACLTFTRNTFGTNGITAHLWSLSVEEQFYLLWPTALLLLLIRKNLRSLLIAIGCIIVLAPLFRGGIAGGMLPEYPISPMPQPPALKLTYLAIIIVERFFTYADALAFGCLAATLITFKPEQVRAKLTNKPIRPAMAALACIILPLIIDDLTKRNPLTICVQFANTIQATGFTILLLQSILMPTTGVYQILNWAWIRQIGVLSYSIYIWQQLIWPAPKFIGMNTIWWTGIWLLPLLLIAATSYYILELPLARLRSVFRTECPRSTGDAEKGVKPLFSDYAEPSNRPISNSPTRSCASRE